MGVCGVVEYPLLVQACSLALCAACLCLFGTLTLYNFIGTSGCLRQLGGAPPQVLQTKSYNVGRSNLHFKP